MTRQRHAFILRLWLEPTSGSSQPETGWRGSLEVVETKQRYYFNSFGQVSRILQEVTGWPDQPDSGQAGEEGTMKM